MLLVADLHFEKGSSFALRGMMLPPYDTRETLKALCAAVAASTRGRSSRSATVSTISAVPTGSGDDERETLARSPAWARLGLGHGQS